ncbi:MAG: hypothetical protein WCE23_02050 [Candidatus Binatus sp.]|uniref:hypothetical protein n=1 Tax=Candidatus Binatus sp. TaxID=2811406 RepID=UPI003C7416EF
MAASPARISLLRYSPALILFAIVIADALQHSGPGLWGHVLWGRELLAHGSLPRVNPYSYSAPGFPWLRHEWLSEVLMASMFDKFGPFGLKLLKFVCAAGTICFIVLAESEAAAPAFVQAAILLVVALILVPVMQFRPQIFDYIALAAIIALLARHNWRGSARLWIAIPIVAIWSNLHLVFLIGIVAMGVYGATTLLSDILAGHGPRRGLGIIAITGAAAVSTLCTFLIPPARNTWYILINSILNPWMRNTVADWRPLTAALTSAQSGSIEQQYFVVVLFFFAAAVLSVALTPKGADAPLVAVAAVMLAAAFAALRNIPFAAIAIAPVLANHLGLLVRPREVATAPASSAREMPRTGRAVMEICIAIVAIGFARHDGILTGGIDASGYPADAVNFLDTHGLMGNLLADDGWGQYIIWHCAPRTKVFIDGRFELAYPPAVIRDYLDFKTGTANGSHTLAAYPHDFVLVQRDLPAAKLMDSRRDWRLIYSDDTARLYARADSAAARLEGVPFAGTSRPSMFP